MTSVTTEELIRSADLLEEKVGEYKSQYEQMYSEIDNLRVYYKGQSSDAFNNQILGFRNSLEEMATVVKNYIAYLRSTSQNYISNEEALTESANSLKSI